MSRLAGGKPPKYVALAEEIRSQIQSGVLQPGDRLATFAEMCAQHKVTPTTITNVYSLLQQERLIICERGRGTFVATPPPKAATGLIGVSGLGHMQHPFAAGLMRGFTKEASKCGLELLLVDATFSREWERVDGVITHGTEAPEVLRDLPPGMPAVVVHASVPNAVCVDADDHSGVSALIEHLLSQGHRRIAAMLDSLSPRRVSAYRDSLHAAGIEADPHWIRYVRVETEKDISYAETAYRTMKQWLSEDWGALDCTAIVAQNDDAAHGVIEALRQAGIRVPEEISVTGFDGTEIGSYSKPALTTVEVPLEEIGAAAVELLQRQIQGETVRPMTLTMPVSLKVRDSSGWHCRNTVETSA